MRLLHLGCGRVRKLYRDDAELQREAAGVGCWSVSLGSES